MVVKRIHISKNLLELCMLFLDLLSFSDLFESLFSALACRIVLKTIFRITQTICFSFLTQYYRRRRRRKHLSKYGGDDVGVEEWLKKAKRTKRIKISLIVAAIVTVIVVAIALIVTFVGTPDSSSEGPGADVVFDDELDRSDISRFSAGVLFRKR